ncbi:dihydropteroate synthase [Candidatus Kaiserbacteria bacterium]|nr:dihydropteroate synthase [Candidatus Kaiserbacteria bacterium]
MKAHRPKIVGIVNITADSFSDGGQYLESGAAIEHANKLLAEGADIVEISGASSNPHSAPVPAEVEIERIRSVLEAISRPGLDVSIDATKPEVLRFGMAKHIAYLNDIRGFPDESLYPELAASGAQLVVMHFISDLDKAVRIPKTTREVFDSIYSFFGTRLPALEAAGIARERLIIDPGMGFFLASNPEPSLAVLSHVAELKKHFGLPVMISVSRKSFLRNIAPSPDIDIQSRTLAAEVFAATQGADYIRTHDVRALHQALVTFRAIAESGK